MKEIALTQGYVALVDDEDYQSVSAFKWYARVKREKRKTYVYARRRIGSRCVFLHRVLLDLVDPKVLVDHKNGNTLDNRRINLRVASTSENRFNQARYFNNTSGKKGVSWDKRAGKWRAAIGVRGVRIHLGLFALLDEAGKAYDKAAAKYFGDFVRVNVGDV